MERAEKPVYKKIIENEWCQISVVARIFGHNPVSGLPWRPGLFCSLHYHERVGFATKKFWFFLLFTIDLHDIFSDNHPIEA
ncbi:hypothetical protein [Microcoleus sp. B9-D4]|uniref:hypothetical protein n=1 Tax=Microcoleus sp. B9-D4 TaxID=2818711 RepID=UPI002FD66D57